MCSKCNESSFFVTIAVSANFDTPWQQIHIPNGLSMGFPAFTLSLTTEIMDITHLRISYLIVIFLKICPKYQKSPFPITIAVSANFEPKWHYFQTPHRAFIGQSAITMSLATSLMDQSLSKRFVFRDDFLQKSQLAQFCKNTENRLFLPHVFK